MIRTGHTLSGRRVLPGDPRRRMISHRYRCLSGHVPKTGATASIASLASGGRVTRTSPVTGQTSARSGFARAASLRSCATPGTDCFPITTTKCARAGRDRRACWCTMRRAGAGDSRSVDGRLGVDHVAYLETIDADLAPLFRRLGLPPGRLPRRNRRFHLHYAWSYDAPTRDLVAVVAVAARGGRLRLFPNATRWAGG